MAFWQVHDAKARFSKFLDDAIKKGPQVVTRRGTKAAVLVPYEEWRRLHDAARPSLKELLLTAGRRFDDLIPDRRAMKRRTPFEFS
ncbi:MAG TPA: type II toxin-antitoxin system Phd/YefM family antitoxin [Candidatus Acidoferrales bacterium]|jgi:prevent-host-death family protein|nr:type II toxin-antitoxin system Phd/YefM family antitoxin [Candidatus Acidoferrales bacterium]